MRLRSIIWLVLLLPMACSGPPPPESSDGSWVGTITTEGNVTTVVNESGSVWGGAARLVEQASIGVAAGAEEYMLGAIAGIAVHADRIYVLDRQVPALRVYDLDGKHVADFGGEGAGPGEFNRPFSVAVSADGRVFVRDTTQGRISVYGDQGESLDTWPMDATYFSSRPMVVTRDGVLHTEVVVGGNAGSPERRTGLQAYAPDGTPAGIVSAPDFGFERRRVIVRRGQGTSTFPVPFAPAPSWTLAVSGAMVAGIGDEYRYEVRHPDDETMLVVREVERVPLDPDELAYTRRSFRQRIDRAVRGDGIVEGADPAAIPELKPAFFELIAGQQGSVWVRRDGPGEYREHCDGTPESNPCWRRTVIVDAFGADGRYAGEIEIPDGARLSTRPYISGDVVVAVFEDPAGTIMVKRYRLVPPGTS